MKFGSQELIDAINDSLRELRRRIDGEHPRPGSFARALTALKGICHPSTNRVGFPHVEVKELERLCTLLERDDIRGNEQITPTNLRFAASLMTRWHDCNLEAQARQARNGDWSAEELAAWQANSAHAASACR